MSIPHIGGQRKRRTAKWMLVLVCAFCLLCIYIGLQLGSTVDRNLYVVALLPGLVLMVALWVIAEDTYRSWRGKPHYVPHTRDAYREPWWKEVLGTLGLIIALLLSKKEPDHPYE